jgi:predicted AlkP superfamily phosphohydrolase/phosphomutase
VVRDLLPKDFRKALARRLPTGLRDTLAQRVDSADIDWARTRAYSLPTDLEGYVRINLKGREPMGVVEPGADYEQACDELQRELAALVDPETNRPLVREVVRTDAAYRGERRPYLPDLVVGWRAEQPIAAAASPRIGTVSAPSPDQRPGTHAPPGFVVIRGPGVAAGTTLQDAHVFDLAPTLLTRCGVAVPDAMRGRAWMAAP